MDADQLSDTKSPSSTDKGPLATDVDTDLEQPIVPDQFDEKYRTTKWEIWAYYACVDN